MPAARCRCCARLRNFPGAEILPPEAQAQVEALGWEEVFDEAGAVVIEGFESHWNPDEPVVKPGPFQYVERTALARSALTFVTKRGAMVYDVQRLPQFQTRDGEVVHLDLDGVERRFDAAIDATGRAAAWSRPVCRQGCQVADVFEGPPVSPRLRGRVVSDIERKRWALPGGPGRVDHGRHRRSLPVAKRTRSVAGPGAGRIGRGLPLRLPSSGILAMGQPIRSPAAGWRSATPPLHRPNSRSGPALRDGQRSRRRGRRRRLGSIELPRACARILSRLRELGPCAAT